MKTKKERLKALSVWGLDTALLEKETTQWFLDHSEVDYEWYLTGRGSMFRKRNFMFKRMSVFKRLLISLELLDVSEVQLWHGLGWDRDTVCLAHLRTKTIQLSTEQWIAIAQYLGISKEWLLYGIAPLVK